jgi:hypothetical protein
VLIRTTAAIIGRIVARSLLASLTEPGLAVVRAPEAMLASEQAVSRQPGGPLNLALIALGGN